MTQTSDPVSLMIANVVRPGRESEYRSWVAGISDEARQFEGYRGSQVIKPAKGENRTFHALIHFSDHHSLAAWKESEVRKTWLKKLPDLVESSEPGRLEGIEFWFEPPQANNPHKPSRSRMALITLLAIV